MEMEKLIYLLNKRNVDLETEFYEALSHDDVKRMHDINVRLSENFNTLCLARYIGTVEGE